MNFIEIRKKITPSLVIKYGVAGGASVGGNLITIYVLTNILGLWYELSACIAYGVAIAISFLLQKLWTFQDRSWVRGRSQALLYTLFSIVNLGVNLGLLYIAVEVFHIWYFTAQIVIATIIAVESFLLSTFVIFHVKEEVQKC